jgi:hypothetical protein
LDDIVAVSDHCLLLDPRPLRPARLRDRVRDRVRDTDHHARPETPQVAVNGSDGDYCRYALVIDRVTPPPDVA